jgi:hypothetical protein
MFTDYRQTKGKAEMKKIYTIWVGVLLITIFFAQTSCSPVSFSGQTKVELPGSSAINQNDSTAAIDLSASTTHDPEPNRDAELAKIRSATLEIRMQIPQTQNKVGLDVGLGWGMGSVIRFKGENLLVTHNHWGNLLQELTIVEFRNADNQMIKPVYGYEFKEWIVYQDAGTLVLKLPQELFDSIASISMDVIPQIVPGETVDVVYRENPAREKATILQAVVEQVITYKGLPAYRLRCLDGQPIQPGDSGGGIWYKGALVANNWVTLMEKSGSAAETSGSLGEESLNYTDLSYAAMLTLGNP